MKKLVLFAMAATISVCSFAQKSNITIRHTGDVNLDVLSRYTKVAGTAAKTTAVGDTVVRSHIGSSDTPTIYLFPGDTGFVSGTNYYGDKGFATRFDYDGVDSTVQVMGVLALFGGTVNPSTTKTVTFNAWTQGPKTLTSYSPNIYYSGFPNTSLASVTVPITQLGIGTTSGSSDTLKAHWFTTPTAYLADSFFIGYTISYSWASMGGDTIALYTNRNGNRTSPAYYVVSSSDTTLNDVECTQLSDGTWTDNVFEGTGLFNNYYIAPILKVGPGTGAVRGVSNKGLTYYSAFPNPANNSTNVRFSLASATDATIAITDMTGHVITQITETKLSAGEHTIPVSTANLAAGNYLLVLRTANGDGMGVQLTVTK